MKIDCVADLHGEYPELEGGDLLIVAGDVTGSDKPPQYVAFFCWLARQKYRKKILIGGNHDGMLHDIFPVPHQFQEFEYLLDSGTEFEGFKIWGSPWSLWFHGINPRCKYFTCSEYEIAGHYKKIPSDVDILITHTPPFGILDTNRDEHRCGSHALLTTLEERIKPKLHIFGHIHEWGGNGLIYKRPGYGDENNTICVNCSIMNEDYEAVNSAMRYEL